MRTANYIIAFIIISIGIAFTIRTSDINPKQHFAQLINSPRGNKAPDILIKDQWDMPDVLKEISALHYIDDKHFACIQDELGKIFIFNTDTKQIEKEIPFAGLGDYEGLAIAGNTAYVLSADGNIIQVKDFNGPKPQIIEHEIHLKSKQDPEGLCFDPRNNRLLVAIKGKDLHSDDYKGIYSFDLKSLKLSDLPVIKIDFNDDAFKEFKGKKISRTMQPSDIAIHPQTGDLYITEGANPKLLVMQSSGAVKYIKKLKTKDFDQPEGLSFSPDGKLFISNEGKGEPGNILAVEVEEEL